MPGPGPVIFVASGETMFAGVRWTVGDRANPGTFVAVSIRLTPPGETDSINVTTVGADGRSGGYVAFDLTSAQVGTLRPAADGVPVFCSRYAAKSREPGWYRVA